MSKFSKGPVLLFIVLVIIVAAASWWGINALQKAPEGAEGQAGDSGQQPPSAVKVATVVIKQARQTHRVTGSLRAASRAEVAAKEDGAVEQILADEGDHVKQGQILVRIDARRLEAQLAQAQANITTARSLITQREAEVSRSKTDFDAKKGLYDQRAISQSDYLDAEREYKVALSQEKASRDALTAASAALALLEVRQTDLVIRAPFDAQVVARNVEPGEWLRAGDPVMTLVSDGKLEVWLQVPERFAGYQPSTELTLSINGLPRQATNARAVPEADPSSRVTTLIADVADPDHTLFPGLSVTAEIPVSPEQPYLVVPADAIVTTYAGSAIFRASASDGGPPVAERLPVEVLFQRDNLVYLAEGALQENDLVVIEGNERLFPMTPLAFEPPADEATTGSQPSSDPDA